MSAVFPIEDKPRYATFTASAGQTLFDIPFEFLQDEDLQIRKTPAAGGEAALLTLAADYTVAGAGVYNGGSFTLTVGAAAGDVLEVWGAAVLERSSSIVRGGMFKSTTIDREHDRHRIIQQELKRESDRALKVPLGATGARVDLPDLPNRLLATDAFGNIGDGGPLVDVSAAVEAANAAEAAQASSEAARIAAEAARDSAIAALGPYLPLTGGVLAGNLSVDGNFSAAGRINASSNVTSGDGVFYSDALPQGNASYWFRDHNGTLRGATYWNRSDDKVHLHNQGGSSVWAGPAFAGTSGDFEIGGDLKVKGGDVNIDALPGLNAALSLRDENGLQKAFVTWNRGTGNTLFRAGPTGQYVAVNSTNVIFSTRPRTAAGEQLAYLSEILNGGGGGGTAAGTSFTPYLDIDATTVQGAIEELEDRWHDVLPTFTDDVRSTGMPGLNDSSFMIYRYEPTGFDPNPTLRIDRHMFPNTVAGDTSSTYKALWVNAQAGENVQGYEWAFTSQLDTYHRGDLGAENLAVNGTTFAQPNGYSDGRQTGKIWGGNLVADDRTGIANPLYGRVGVEVNSFALASAGTDANKQRIGVQIALGSTNGNPVSPLHFSRAILVGANHTNVKIDTVLDVAGEGTYAVGLDFAKASFTHPIIMAAEGQRIALDAHPSGSGFYNRSIEYSAGTLVYRTQNGVVFSVDDNGNASFTGNVSALNV